MSRRCMGCMEVFEDGFDVCPHCGYIVGTSVEEAIHIQPGTLLHDRYIIGKVLGYGGFGVTYIGWDNLLQQKVAIKEYFPGEFSTRMPGQSQVTAFGGDKAEQFRDGMEKFVDEAKRLAKFQNESGIVRVFDSFTENLTAYIIMEYLDGETLSVYLKREKKIPEERAIEMLMPVIHSLQVVHNEGILHRDISPDNIFLLKNGEVKLIDFGASRYATTSHSRSLTVIIKPGYSPEEQYRSRGDQGPYTDVYALGAVLYKMITGTTPPDAMERRAKYENQSKDILERPHKLVKELTQNCENAILNAMNVRVEDRTPDIATFMHELTTNGVVVRRKGRIKRIPFYTWPLWAKIAVPAVLVLMVTFSALLLTGVIKFQSRFSEVIEIPEGISIVPGVEGMDSDAAIALILTKELLVEKSGNIESEYLEPGQVVIQSPAGGTYLEKNSKVIVVISSGKEVEEAKDGVAVMPYLIAGTKEEAIEKLKKAGFDEPVFKEANDNFTAAGCIISQSIKFGTEVREGENKVVELLVSLGPAAIVLEDYTGQDYETAKNDLTAKGIQVTPEYEKSNTIAENVIISQDIEAGSEIKYGDTIVLRVSSGKNLAVVDNVVGKTKDEASKTLKGNGFKVNVLENYNASVPSGQVISQTPAGGTSQVEGSGVTIYVSKGKQPETSASTVTQTPVQQTTPQPTQQPVPQPPKESNWSEWTETLPANITTDKYDVNTKTQYSSRTKTTITVDDKSSAESGWTLEDESSSYSDYGGWSDYSESRIDSSDTVQVEYKIQYKLSDSGYWVDDPDDDEGWDETRTVYRSRTREIVYSYTYSKWSDWSDYSDTAIMSSSNVDVRTKTLYQYKSK